jgi:exodeoxyribonuclease V gamma subunit
VSVFGATRLDPEHLRVLSALADHRDVHFWLVHPSPALWASVKAATQGNGIGPTHMHRELTGPRRADDTTEALVHHRLLAYLGRDVRELQLALTKISPNAADVRYQALEPTEPPSVLGRLQSDIAANQAPRPQSERPLLDRDDKSM